MTECKLVLRHKITNKIDRHRDSPLNSVRDVTLVNEEDGGDVPWLGWPQLFLHAAEYISNVQTVRDGILKVLKELIDESKGDVLVFMLRGGDRTFFESDIIRFLAEGSQFNSFKQIIGTYEYDFLSAEYLDSYMILKSGWGGSVDSSLVILPCEVGEMGRVFDKFWGVGGVISGIVINKEKIKYLPVWTNIGMIRPNSEWGHLDDLIAKSGFYFEEIYDSSIFRFVSMDQHRLDVIDLLFSSNGEFLT